MKEQEIKQLDFLESWRHQYYAKMGIYLNYAKYREELQAKHLKQLLADLL